jgi:hypothetical protein
MFTNPFKRRGILARVAPCDSRILAEMSPRELAVLSAVKHGPAGDTSQGLDRGLELPPATGYLAVI